MSGVARVIFFCGLGGAFVGCASYIIEPGRLLLADVEDVSISEVRAVVGPFLEAEGFADLGLDEEMMRLVGVSATEPESVSSFRAYLLREYTYLNERRNLRVVVTDYTDPQLERPTFQYSAPEDAFFEIAIYEDRPGGFSRSAHEFFYEFARELSESLPVSFSIATEPPETRADEYWIITIAGIFGGALYWLIVFGVSAAIIGSLFFVVLSRIPITVGVKRSLFVLGNTWLATPLPFPAASILVILLPHAFAFPWNRMDYYDRVLDVALISFPITLALSIAVSLKLFSKDRHQRRAS